MPAFSMVCWTWASVEVRDLICPANDSIRRTVPMAIRERLASSICSQPSNTRAARNCLPVITRATVTWRRSQPQITEYSNYIVDYDNQFMAPLFAL
jgi:hypothetical protein